MTTVRMRRGIALSLLAAAVFAGPAEAACSSCCPSESRRELALGSENCCGDDCAPILERAPADSIPAGVNRSCAVSVTVAAAAPIPLPELSAASPASAAFDLPPPPLPRLSPLRL